MTDLARAIRFAFRRLIHAPLFTSVAVLTLAVGIGANSAIFSVVDAVLLEPLPYPGSDRLIAMTHTAPIVSAVPIRLSEAFYFTYRDGAKTLDAVGLASPNQATVSGVGEPERVASLIVTEATLPMLGAPSVLGRLFSAADDRPGAPPTVVLGNGYWLRRFGGARDVVGRSVTLDGTPHEIIGVLGPGFRVLDTDAELYLPARFDPASAELANFNFPGIARLAAGATIEQAIAEGRQLVQRAADRYPSRVISREQFNQAGITPAFRSLKSELVGDVGPVLWVLVGTVGMVLLMACANVANLFLVQADGRQREVAMRTALGASRRSIVGGFLAESLLLSAFAGAVGLLLTWAGLRVLVAIGPESLPRLHEIGIDGSVLSFTLGISLLAGILFGLAPALRYGRTNLVAGLKEGSRGAGSGKERHRVRNGLVVAQVALALVLLIGSGLMIRTVRALRDVDPGIRDPEQVTTFHLFVPDAEVPEPATVLEIGRRVGAALRTLPGVTSASVTGTVPMSDQMSLSPILVEDGPADPGAMTAARRFDFVAPEFAATLGIPLVAGRAIEWADIDRGSDVVMISENLAREYWGEPAAAIGKRIADFGARQRWFEVVGVLADVRASGVTEPAPTTVYWPFAVRTFWDAELFVPRNFDVVVRRAAQAPLSPAAIRQAVWSENPGVPITELRTMQDLLDRSMARASFAMVMLGIAAAVALGLGLVGIYGVVSYIVTERTREIGVRIALGAEPRLVRRMVIRQAGLVAGVGVLIGLGLAIGLTRLMASLLYDVRAFDPATYLAVVALILGVVTLASYLPARRAARIDPVEALRAD